MFIGKDGPYISKSKEEKYYNDYYFDRFDFSNPMPIARIEDLIFDGIYSPYVGIYKVEKREDTE